MTARELVAATRNPAKIAQLAALVAGLAVVRPPAHDISCEEDADIEAGDDLAEIAQRKALAFSRFESDRLLVATDGGLIMPALPSWRPARTKRFAGEHASNRDRADALLSMARGLTGPEREVSWCEAMTVARDDRVLATWVAESPPGLLATDYDPADLTGNSGFWLPALWRCPEFGGKRLIDLTPAERTARLDHWQILGRELRGFVECL